VVAKTVLYVSPLPFGSNPAVDSITAGLQFALQNDSMKLRVVFDDVRTTKPADSLPKHLSGAITSKVDAIIFYVVDPEAGRSEVKAARAAGIPVFSIARPRFPVNASLSYPGFNQGVFMMDYLSSLLPAGSGVGVIGGPHALTDSEEVAGLVFSAQRSHCKLVNDPLLPEYSNLTDNVSGARAPAKLLLERYPDVKGLAPYNDETMLGLVEYLSEIGRTGELKIVSRNGTPAAVQAIREGKTTGTWDLDPPSVGMRIAALASEHLRGAQLYDDFAAMSSAGRMITIENLHTWRPWEERVPIPSLNSVLSVPGSSVHDNNLQ
jgi:ABC-type sugar transport system substrate-binding protein